MRPAKQIKRRRAKGRSGDPQVPFGHLGGWSVALSIALGLAAFDLFYVIQSVRYDIPLQEGLRERTFVFKTDLAADHGHLVGSAKATVVFVGLAVIVWLIWQYQAHANLRALTRAARFHPVVGVVMWVIPGINVFGPLLALGDLWRRSDPYAVDRSLRRRWSVVLVWMWWAACVAALVLAAAAYRSVPRAAATPAELIHRDNLLTVACAVGMAATLPAMVLVNKIDERLRLKEDGAGVPEWRPWSAAR